jgi:hypothetical protein
MFSIAGSKVLDKNAKPLLCLCCLISMLAGKRYFLRRFKPHVDIYLRIHHHHHHQYMRACVVRDEKNCMKMKIILHEKKSHRTLFLKSES